MSLRRFTLASCLAVLLLTANGSVASASLTIGQVAPQTPSTRCQQQFDVVQPTVTSGNTYVAPATGEITSWTHNAAAGPGQMLTLKIFRKVADPATYMVVGHDGPHPLTGAALNTFPTSIAVKAGDVLGVNSANAADVDNACAFNVPGELIWGRLGELGDGASGDFISDPNERVNATALLTPSNKFTLGGIKRNKKKGTATLAVNVPNPGELALSGKGVRRARAARAAAAAKTIPAAGKVKLTIRAKGKKKRKLKKNGKVTLKPKITYTPAGGDPSRQSRKLTLKKR